jgi:hypothetical protein
MWKWLLAFLFDRRALLGPEYANDFSSYISTSQSVIALIELPVPLDFPNHASRFLSVCLYYHMDVVSSVFSMRTPMQAAISERYICCNMDRCEQLVKTFDLPRMFWPRGLDQSLSPSSVPPSAEGWQSSVMKCDEVILQLVTRSVMLSIALGERQ